MCGASRTDNDGIFKSDDWQNCANQIYWWDSFKKEVKKHNLKPKSLRFMTPAWAEWVAGRRRMLCEFPHFIEAL